MRPSGESVNYYSKTDGVRHRAGPLSARTHNALFASRLVTHNATEPSFVQMWDTARLRRAFQSTATISDLFHQRDAATDRWIAIKSVFTCSCVIIERFSTLDNVQL